MYGCKNNVSYTMHLYVAFATTHAYYLSSLGIAGSLVQASCQTRGHTKMPLGVYSDRNSPSTVDELTIVSKAIGCSSYRGYGVALHCSLAKTGYVFWWPTRLDYHRAVQQAAQSTRLGVPKTVLELCEYYEQYPDGDAAIRALLGYGRNMD